MKITLQQLQELGACCDSQAVFSKLFPNGMEVTETNLHVAIDSQMLYPKWFMYRTDLELYRKWVTEWREWSSNNCCDNEREATEMRKKIIIKYAMMFVEKWDNMPACDGEHYDAKLDEVHKIDIGNGRIAYLCRNCYSKMREEGWSSW